LSGIELGGLYTEDECEVNGRRGVCVSTRHFATCLVNRFIGKVMLVLKSERVQYKSICERQQMLKDLERLRRELTR
jgi:hypothetical protein